MPEDRRLIGLGEILAFRMTCGKCKSAAEIAVSELDTMMKHHGATLVNCQVCGQGFPGGGVTRIAQAIGSICEASKGVDWLRFVMPSEAAPDQRN